MLKIQKMKYGQWTDFVTFHDRGFGADSFRVITDEPHSEKSEANLLAAVEHIRADPEEVISLLTQIIEGFGKFRDRQEALADDRVGAVMEDIEFDRLERLSESERKYMIGLAMLGFDAAMLLAQTVED